VSEQVASARQKFNCPACGAEANWNPAKQALICPFCGTESPAELKTVGADTVIVEHDLAEAIRGIPDSARGWQTAKMSVRCQSCQAISVFDPQQIGKRCEFCGSSALVPYEEVKEPFRPESLLPLKISESQARDLIREWYQRQWLAPNALNARALTDTVKGIYLPYWTFDAKAFAQWTADSGTYYYTMSNGRRERHVRWTPAAGELSHVFDDDLVPAAAFRSRRARFENVRGGAAEFERGLGSDGLNVGDTANTVRAEKFSFVGTHRRPFTLTR
jgi:Zn finger protein HypA/HybF involved in hydrogenase expression